jgi:tripartite-type tricarboxylate transporter receptor subunit TctC
MSAILVANRALSFGGASMSVKCALFITMLALCVGIVSLQPTAAQTYPTRLVKLVVPGPPGGASEAVIRILAERLSSTFGQPFIVENRPGGAGGVVGAKSVATAEPDGYTLLVTSPGPMVVAPAIYKNIGYDPLRNFVPVAGLLRSPQMLAVNPNLPVNSLQELVAYAKANPGKVNFSSPGYGTQPHLLGEMFKLQAGISLVHVPYKGAAAAITDLLSGQVQMEFENIPLLLPHVEAGKLKAVAIADERRLKQLPNVPTTSEAGLPKLQATFWSAIVAPAGTPPAIVGRLNAAINEILKSNDIEASLNKLSANAQIGTPQDLALFIETESKKWTEVAVAANIKAE